MLRSVSLSGEIFVVRDEGRGPPLLLVHGFPLDHTMWEAQIEALAPRFRVLAPDLRGFGRSAVTDGTVSMARMSDDLAAVLDALDVREPLVYAGFSMGGYVGWEFLARHGRRVRALAAVDTRASADTPEGADGRRKMADEVLAKGAAVAADAMVPKLLAAGRPDSDPELARHVREIILRNDPRGIAAAQRGMAERADWRAKLGELRLPFLVLAGQKDGLISTQEQREMAAAVPGARYVEIADAGHTPPMERPAAVNDALRSFLASLDQIGTPGGRA
jgi:pimeloyl-ACP methyl ester carboxylesterase